MLQLLQQRTKLSGKIGAMKRRHGAVVYVPERERDLIARLLRVSKGQPSACAVVAVYREILSSSRAAQGQAPVGYLKASAAFVLSAGRAAFGACDRFAPKKSWRDLATNLESGEVALALLTGEDLSGALATAKARKAFTDRFTVVAELGSAAATDAAAGEPVFIVTPRSSASPGRANRIVILIECKSTLNAIKSLLHVMPGFSHAEQLCRGKSLALVRLRADKLVDGARAERLLLSAAAATEMSVSLLGIYPATEVYGG